MATTKTQLRIAQPIKKLLNATAKDAGYTAELLAELLLTDALNQIHDVRMPAGVLQHVRIVRERLGLPVSDDFEARVERYLANRDQAPPHLLNEASPKSRRQG